MFYLSGLSFNVEIAPTCLKEMNYVLSASHFICLLLPVPGYAAKIRIEQVYLHWSISITCLSVLKLVLIRKESEITQQWRQDRFETKNYPLLWLFRIMFVLEYVTYQSYIGGKKPWKINVWGHIVHISDMRLPVACQANPHELLAACILSLLHLGSFLMYYTRDSDGLDKGHVAWFLIGPTVVIWPFIFLSYLSCKWVGALSQLDFSPSLQYEQCLSR